MPRKKLFLAAMLTLCVTAGFAQGKFFTKTGKIEFYSKAALEDIEGKNKTVTAVIDTKTGALQFAVQMKGFEFEKQLMQQHFNENYAESDKYPKAEFKGAVVTPASIDFTKEGSYPARVKGKLTLHGVTRELEATGTIKVAGGRIEMNSSLNLLLSDYNIRIPAVVRDKISNSIKVTIDCKLEPLKG